MVVPKGGLIIDCRKTKIFLWKEVMVEDVGTVVAATFQGDFLLGIFHIAASGGKCDFFWSFVTELRNTKKVVLKEINKINNFYLNLFIQLDASMANDVFGCFITKGNGASFGVLEQTENVLEPGHMT